LSYFNSLNTLGNNYASLRENMARLELVFAILDSPREQSAKGSGHIIPVPIHAVEFRNLHFGYTPSTKVLKDISFEITNREFFGITGQSGSGKPTLIRLLARFYEPDGGEIFVNDQLIQHFNLHSLRSAIGIVFQENLILNDTIKNNIIYGINHNVSQEQVESAAKIAQVDEFSESLPDQYGTMIGEGGRSLSGGERQRISIARAIIADPEILILDEGTAFLELDQEKRILQNLKELRRGRITVIISHRLSAIKAADRILVIDNGRLVESDLKSIARID